MIPETTHATQHTEPTPPAVEVAPQRPKKRRPGPASKISQLPKHQRDQINHLLDEGAAYDRIIEEMAKLQVRLNANNLSNWFKYGYQDYLSALEWQAELQQFRQSVAGLGEDPDELLFHRGVVQFGLTQVFRAIKDDSYKDDPHCALRL